MENYIDVLIDIPCFACLFWKSERESYVNCNPIECQALTEWLQELAENSSTAKIFAVKDGELKIHLHKRRSHT